MCSRDFQTGLNIVVPHGIIAHITADGVIGVLALLFADDEPETCSHKHDTAKSCAGSNSDLVFQIHPDETDPEGNDAEVDEI